MFPMFQLLAPDNLVDKCGHHYTICIDLKHPHFEVLDSVRSGDDDSLTTHAEFFIDHLKEMWSRHYECSKVRISQFPINYVTMARPRNGRDCGSNMLEYLAKWEGRRVPVIRITCVAELR
ncbi:hypothetical protein ZWY2020_052405 [Hordeum vulgare]|nr:hypothetical protein ZWY2020_052405 [Hordeum vulgare]